MLPTQIRMTVTSAILAVSLGAWPFSLNAFEATLTLPEGADGIRKLIEGSSLVFAAERDGVEDPHDITASARADYRRLLSTLYDAGYFGPEIRILVDGREAATLPPFETIRSVHSVELHVSPGSPFKFGQTALHPIAADSKITERFASGQPATTSIITQAAREAVAGWRNQGHAKAQVVSQSITADHPKAQLDVDIGLNPGPKLRFGALHVSGKSKISEERLREIIALPVGETFSPDELDRIGRRLRRAGAFRSVSITEADQVGPNETLDIDIRLEDDKPRRITFGAELESRDGLSLSANWLHRNFLGGGERLLVVGEVKGIGAQYGGTDFNLSAELTRPATLQADTDLSFRIGIESIDHRLYLLEKAGAYLAFTRVFSDRLTISAGGLVEASNSKDGYGYRQFRTVGVPIRATLDQRDDKLDATKGFYLSGAVVPYASTGDGAPGTYLFADTRAYRQLGSKRVVAAARLQLGSIIGPELAETPPDLLFLSGGGGTVRGQPYESNSVTVGGIESGGLSFIGVSGELRVKTTETISAVAFYDAGFVGETSNLAGAGNWHAGAGLGIRYHTSIGPIRVDLGFPVSGSTSGGTQLYVGIGQAF